MAIINAAILAALNTALNSSFQAALSKQREESFWRDVATLVPSGSTSNTYGWLGDFPALREWIGDRVVRDMKAQGYTLDNKLYESTVGVKRTDIEDDNFGHYKPLAANMGHAAAEHPDLLLSQLIQAAQSTACYDGQNFLDTDHPVFPNVDGTGAAQTVANFKSGGGDAGPLWMLLDTRKPLKPFIFQERTKPEFTAKTDPKSSDAVFDQDVFKYGIRYRCNAGFGFWQMAYGSTEELTAETFNAARLAMRKFTADGGRPLGITPNVIVVPPELEAQAEALFDTPTLPTGGANPLHKKVRVIAPGWL